MESVFSLTVRNSVTDSKDELSKQFSKSKDHQTFSGELSTEEISKGGLTLPNIDSVKEED